MYLTGVNGTLII